MLFETLVKYVLSKFGPRYTLYRLTWRDPWGSVNSGVAYEPPSDGSNPLYVVSSVQGDVWIKSEEVLQCSEMRVRPFVPFVFDGGTYHYDWEGIVCDS